MATCNPHVLADDWTGAVVWEPLLLSGARRRNKGAQMSCTELETLP
jgi:hypothetical protein